MECELIVYGKKLGNDTTITIARQTVLFGMDFYAKYLRGDLSPEDWFAYKSNTIQECVDDMTLELATKQYKNVKMYVVFGSRIEDTDDDIDYDRFNYYLDGIDVEKMKLLE